MSDVLKSINRMHLIVLAAIVVIGGGYAYYKYMYSPAKLVLTTAQMHQDTAQKAVTEKQAQLAGVEQKLNSTKSKEGLGKNIIAKEAIPHDEDAAEAMVQVDRLARLSSVAVTDQSIAQNVGGAQASTSGSSSTLQVEAHGSYTAIILFLGKLQEMVEARAGKLYVHGRLMNVTNMTIKTPDGGNEDSNNPSTDLKEPLPPGHIGFSITIRLYSSSAPAATTPGAATPSTTPTTPAAGTPTTPATGTSTTPSTSSSSTTTTPATSSTTTPSSSTTSPSSTSIPSEKS